MPALPRTAEERLSDQLLTPLAAAVAGACAQQEADGKEREDDGDGPAAFDGRWNRDQQRADGRAQREDDVGHMDDRDTPDWR